MDAVSAAWEAGQPGSGAKANVRVPVPGWEPPPGHTDLALWLEGDSEATIASELKVLDVDQTLWDALKLISIIEHVPPITSAYLIVATTPKRWREAEVAELYGPADSAAPDGVRDWPLSELLERWKRSWRYLLEGGRGRPVNLPGRLRTRFICAHPVGGFPGYEVRCISVEPLDSGPRQRFNADGWPIR